jgi:hypothetical protein
MPVLCISLPALGSRFRAVIIVVIYLVALRLAPGQAVPLLLGSTLGGRLAIEVRQALAADRIQERAR